MNQSEIITFLVKSLTKKFVEDYGIPVEMINQGECDRFAEELCYLAKDRGIEGEILSDGLFFDPFDDLEPEMMWDISEYGSKPNNFDSVGLPSHYWFYYSGRHYDSDTPQGVENVFDLPIIYNFYC